MDFAFRCLGFSDRTFVIDGDESVEAGIEFVDAIKTRFCEIDR